VVLSLLESNLMVAQGQERGSLWTLVSDVGILRYPYHIQEDNDAFRAIGAEHSAVYSR